MAKSTAHFFPLPADHLPPFATSALLSEMFDREQARGGSQGDVAKAIGFGRNLMSMLRSGASVLAVPRVLPMAAALHLNDEETDALLDVRYRELHGRDGEYCYVTQLRWAKAVTAPVGGEARVREAWTQATGDCTSLVDDVLDDPQAFGEVSAVIEKFVQSRLQQLHEESREA